MRSIAVMNQKGGVGKTTTTVNLGAALAEAGRRVCLVDIDPQAHATLHLGIDINDDTPSIHEVLSGGASLADARQRVCDNLWIVGSRIELVTAEMELADRPGRELILRDKLKEDSSPFDYLLIDCPPSLGVLTLNALAAVEEVFIPLQPHFLALHGLSRLLETIDLVARRVNKRLKLSGVVLCMFDSTTRLAAEVGRDVDEFFARSRDSRTPWSEATVFQTRIRRNVRLAEAPSFGQSILEYSPNSHGAEDYRGLAVEVSAR